MRRTGIMHYVAAALMALGLAACSKPAPEMGVSFVQPQDGATVSSPVKVVMAVKGMKIHPAGEILPGTGHFHLIIDEGEGSYIPMNGLIVKDRSHLHFGKGQTETTIRLFPGKHTLTLQFGDGHHRSYGRKMSQTITIHVK